MRDWPTLYRIYAVFVLLLVLNLAVFAIDRDFFGRVVAGEDGLTEWIGFAGFLIAGMTGVGVISRYGRSMHRGVLLLLLGLTLFHLLCAGEEISWGQRLFGFVTPEAVVKHNQQQEFNLHNLQLPVLHSRDIVGVYVYLYGVFLPVFFAWRSSARNSAWRGWVFHPGIAGCFLFAELLNAIREPFCAVLEGLGDPAVHVLAFNQIEETVEMYWGLSAMFGMLLIQRYWRRSPARLKLT